MFNILKKALRAICVIIVCIAPCTPTAVFSEPTDFPPATGGGR